MDTHLSDKESWEMGATVKDRTTFNATHVPSTKPLTQQRTDAKTDNGNKKFPQNGRGHQPYKSRLSEQLPKHHLNHQIKASHVRLVYESTGVDKQHSKTVSEVMTLPDALRKAQELNQDLIEINPKAAPPVCKIMDYGKFLYREQKNVKKDKKSKSKEIGFHVNIASHDFDTKMRQATGFLSENCPVTFKIQFRGRECAHKEIGIMLFERVASSLAHHGRQDGPPRVSGKYAMLRICPTSKKK